MSQREPPRVKIMYCLCRDSEFNSLYPGQASQSCLSLQLLETSDLFVHLHSCACIHIQIYTSLKLKNILRASKINNKDLTNHVTIVEDIHILNKQRKRCSSELVLREKQMPQRKVQSITYKVLIMCSILGPFLLFQQS